MESPAAPPFLSNRKHRRVSRNYSKQREKCDAEAGISCSWQVTECFSLLGLRNMVKKGPLSAAHEANFRNYVYVGYLQRGMIMAIGCAVGHALVTLVFGDAWYYSSWLLTTWQQALGGVTVAVDMLCLPVLAYGMFYRDSNMGQVIERHSQMIMCTFLCTMVTCHLLVSWSLEVRECDSKLTFRREEHVLIAWPTMTLALFPHMYTLTIFIAFMQSAGLHFKNLVMVDFYVIFLLLLSTSSVLYCGELNRVTGEFIFINFSQVLLSMFFGAIRCYRIEATQRQTFQKITEAQILQIAAEKVHDVLLPKRLRQSDSQAPAGLLMENFPMVSVMFCRFCLVERDSYSEEELQVFGRCMLEIDDIIVRHNLFKVEHIGEDLLIGSPILQAAPQAAAHQYEADALAVVSSAHELIRACAEISRETGVAIDFAVGVHTGPIAGALAGRLRRFYRLFGTTLNTAARLCQGAPNHHVHISHSTRQLLRGMDHRLCPQGLKHFKGRGYLETYFVSAPQGASGEDTQELHNAGVVSLEIVPDMTRDDDKAAEYVHRTLGADRKRPHTWPVAGGAQFGQQFSSLHDQVQRGMSPEQRLKSFTEESSSGGEGSEGFVSANRQNKPTTLPCENASRYETELNTYEPHHSGTYVDKTVRQKDLENQFCTSNLQRYLLILLLIHVVCFPTMILATYRQLEFKNHMNPGRSVEVLASTGIGLVLVATHAIAVYLVFAGHFKCDHTRLQRIVLACSMLSSIGTLGASITTSFGFGFVGFLFYVSMHQQVTSSLLESALLVWIPIAVSIVLPAMTRWWGDDDWIVNFYHDFILVYYAVVGVYPFNVVNSWLLSINQRKAWSAQHQLDAKLNKFLLDIVPSASVAAFVRNRQSHLSQLSRVSSKDLMRHLTPSFWMFQENQAVVLRYDLAGFTKLCMSLEPKQVVSFLHEIWSLTDSLLYATQYKDANNRFDANKHFKLNTIGDCYVVAETCSSEQDAMKEFITSKLILLGISIMTSLREYIRTDHPHIGISANSFSIRMGIACDICTCGVFGLLKPRYDVLGKAMKVAKTVEEEADSLTIRLCNTTADMLNSAIDRYRTDQMKTNVEQEHLPKCALYQISEQSDIEVSNVCNWWMMEKAANEGRLSEEQECDRDADSTTMRARSQCSTLKASYDYGMDPNWSRSVVVLGNSGEMHQFNDITLEANAIDFET